VSAAVLLSTLGVEGTITGAALGSVVATAGGAWYSWSLERTHSRLRPKAQNVVARVRPGGRRGQPPAAPISEAPTLPDEPVVGQPIQEDDAAQAVESKDSRRRLRWWMLALAALASFVIAMGAITAYERATGRPLASQVGGKDVGGTTVNPQPAPTPAPTESPTEQPGSPGPTVEGTPDATPTPTRTTTPATPTQTPTTSPTTTNPGGQTPR
jgi:hypothetical protein